MKRFYLASLGKCNQKCIFCARGGDEKPIEFIDTNRAKEVLVEKIREGYDELLFDGGEPTLRKDLPELINYAKEIGFREVTILTNAVSLAQESLVKRILSVRDIKDFNLNFSVSLHSHRKSVSERLTQAPGTFDKTIKGIENLIKNGCCNIDLYYLITEYNYKDLPGFINFVHKKFPEIKYITFSFIYPSGAALKNMKIFPRLSKAAPCFLKALELCRRFQINFSITTCGTIPLCFLKGYEYLLIGQQEQDQPHRVGIMDSRKNTGFKLATKEFHAQSKVKMSSCVNCAYNDECAGIWKVYADRYGTGELKPVSRNTRLKNIRADSANSLDEKTYLLLTGFSCNNKCEFCSVNSRELNFSTEELRFLISKYSSLDYDALQFIGGEPTIRKDFLDLISYAKDCGYKRIEVTTNGRLFSYRRFTEEAARSGLTSILFSLYGHNKTLHDKMTNSPGAFEQCVQGIKNALEYKLFAGVNTVVTKSNYRQIEKISNFIRSLGVKNWHILDLSTDGRGAKVYKRFYVRLDELSSQFRKLEKISGLFDDFEIFNFPLCIFPPGIFKKENVLFATPKMRYEEVHQLSPYSPSERISKKIENSRVVYEDQCKVKTGICARCRFLNDCSGVAEPYLKLHSDREINELFKKHNLEAKNMQHADLKE